jgi:hypothetical protein
MVKYPRGPLDLVFGALEGPTRRAILERLVSGPIRVTGLFLALANPSTGHRGENGGHSYFS